MSEETTAGQATEQANPRASRVFPNVDYAPNPYFEPSASARAVPAETATDANGSTGDTEGDGDGETFVPQDERGSVDPNSPEYKHFQAAYTKARQRDKAEMEKLVEERISALRAELGTQKSAAEPAAPAERAETPSVPRTVDEFYAVDLSGWTPTISFPQDSDLAGYEEAFAPAIKNAIQDGIAQVLGQMKAKASAMEVQQRQASVADKIRSFEAEISVLPEFEDKLPEIRDLATKFRQIALDDPDTWIALVEAKTGLKRGSTAAPGKVVPINPTARPTSAVPRPTRSIPAAPASKQYASVAEGVDAAFRQFGLGR